MFKVFLKAVCTVLCLLSVFTSSVTSTSVFVLNDGGTVLTFAINVVQNTNDIYFRLSGPASKSWIAVGMGSLMQGSQMFLVYTSGDSSNITFSPRLATGHTEPDYSPDIKVSLLEGSGLINGSYVVNARCQNCTSWAGGSLDLKSTVSPWLYAKGPTNGLHSDSVTASIQRHIEYGYFTMNMVQALGVASVPTEFSMNTGSAENGSPHSDNDWTAIAHAVVVSVAFVLLMPMGSIFLRILEKIRWHWINQLLAFSVAFIGAAIGAYLSTTYNSTKSFNSAHQIIGILVIVALIVQVGLGWYHHRVYKLTQKKTLYGSIHRYFGQIVIVLAIANGSIGLELTNNGKYIVAYVVPAIVILAITVAWVWVKNWRSARGIKYGMLRHGEGDREEFGGIPQLVPDVQLKPIIIQKPKNRS